MKVKKSIFLALIFCMFFTLLTPVKGHATNFYTNLSNPVSWIVLSIAGENRTSSIVPCSIGQYFAATMIAEGRPESAVRDSSSNVILDLLSFGNETSIKNLRIATGLGEHFFQYYLFTHNIKSSDSTYLALDLDAFSVLTYGISWAINLPAKFFTQLGVISEITKHEGTFVSIMAYIDPLVNLLSLFIELPLAFFNTLIGMLLAFIFHPIDSLCSFLPFFYFLLKTSLMALINIF